MYPEQCLMRRSLERPRTVSAQPRWLSGDSRCSVAATGLWAQPPAAVRGLQGWGWGQTGVSWAPGGQCCSGHLGGPCGCDREPGLELCTRQLGPSVGRCPWPCPPTYTPMGGSEPHPPAPQSSSSPCVPDPPAQEATLVEVARLGLFRDRPESQLRVATGLWPRQKRVVGSRAPQHGPLRPLGSS